MDAYGHVNNARFLTLLEEARIDLLFGEVSRRHGASLAGGLVLRSQAISYERPVRHGDPLRVELWVAEIGVASFTLDYQAYVGQLLVATASSVLVRFDLAENLVRRLGRDELAFLREFTER